MKNKIEKIVGNPHLYLIILGLYFCNYALSQEGKVVKIEARSPKEMLRVPWLTLPSVPYYQTNEVNVTLGEFELKADEQIYFYENVQNDSIAAYYVQQMLDRLKQPTGSALLSASLSSAIDLVKNGVKDSTLDAQTIDSTDIKDKGNIYAFDYNQFTYQDTQIKYNPNYGRMLNFISSVARGEKDFDDLTYGNLLGSIEGKHTFSLGDGTATLSLKWDIPEQPSESDLGKITLQIKYQDTRFNTAFEVSTPGMNFDPYLGLSGGWKY